MEYFTGQLFLMYDAFKVDSLVMGPRTRAVIQSFSRYLTKVFVDWFVIMVSPSFIIIPDTDGTSSYASTISC